MSGSPDLDLPFSRFQKISKNHTADLRDNVVKLWEVIVGDDDGTSVVLLGIESIIFSGFLPSDFTPQLHHINDEKRRSAFTAGSY